jgi:zinc transport system substrate-binding protein
MESGSFLTRPEFSGMKQCRCGILKSLVISAVMVLIAGSGMVQAVEYNKKEEPKIQVVTTLFPFADWVDQIGGDRVQVICLLPPGASPHTYELTTNDVKVLQRARVLVYNGSGLDDWVGKLVEKSANKNLVKLALAEHLPMAPMPAMIEDEHEEHGRVDHDDADHHEHHHDHTIANCGMWLDPMRVVRMVDLIAQTLSHIDPEHRGYYEERAMRYWGQLDRLDREYSSTLKNVRGGVICLHDDLIYLFRRYNVDIYGIVEPYPGKEPSVEYIRKLTDQVAGKKLLCVISEPQLSLKPAKVLSDQLAVPLVMVDPIGGVGVKEHDSYIALMTSNLRELKKVLLAPRSVPVVVEPVPAPAPNPLPQPRHEEPDHRPMPPHHPGR